MLGTRNLQYVFLPGWQANNTLRRNPTVMRELLEAFTEAQQNMQDAEERHELRMAIRRGEV
jgi:hypothetical protein